MRIFSLVIALMLIFSIADAQNIPPYYNGGNIKGSVDEVGEIVTKSLEEKGFEIIGSYHPKASQYLKVIVFTRADLKTVCGNIEDRGMLAAALKVGLKRIDDSKTVISLLNPEYLFYGFLRDAVKKNKTALSKITNDAKAAIKSIDNKLIGFGGNQDVDDIKDYQYMAFMPYFSDPIEVGEFDSFEAGVAKIKKNLAANKGGTVKVYEMIDNAKKIAVFGVGFHHKKDGEGFFLPIIGEKNIAAMPYEIILMDDEATILAGKFRFAIFWPELTMGEFMKIVETPGDVEDFMEGLCK